MESKMCYNNWLLKNYFELFSFNLQALTKFLKCVDWTQPQEARQVWISFLNLSVQEEQFKVTS